MKSPERDPYHNKTENINSGKRTNDTASSHFIVKCIGLNELKMNQNNAWKYDRMRKKMIERKKKQEKEIIDKKNQQLVYQNRGNQM